MTDSTTLQDENAQDKPIALAYDGTELVQRLFTENNVQLWENRQWYDVVRVTRSIDTR